ncbi:MAG: M14 family metallopeptidase [Pyrinomonadaceae bacterium]
MYIHNYRLADFSMRAFVRITSVSFVLALLCVAIAAQSVPNPKSVLGFNPTDNRTIADWTQIQTYFKKLDAASNRVEVREIGKTTLGKPQIVAFISSEENIKNLDKIRETNAAIAEQHNGKKIDEQERTKLLANGKAIVAIACSIHSTEIVASQMSMQLAYKLASSNDETTKEILNNTVLLLIPSTNPDGVDIVADWYRKTFNTPFEGSVPPELYHYYAGHDNNRDWFMMSLQETRNITKLFWQQWYPEIVYDVHQQGQTGARFTIPPFFDPPNPRISAVTLRELGLIGYKMAADLERKGVKGVVTNATYDTWWHGGFRSAPYFHNSIGILSEAASSNLMTPIEVSEKDLKEKSKTRGMDSATERLTNNPDPWFGGTWAPEDISNIEMIATYSVLEMAGKYRQRYLENSYNLAESNLKPDAAEPQGFVIYAGQGGNEEKVSRLIEILTLQGMHVYEMKHEIEAALSAKAGEELGEIPGGSFYIPVAQVQKPNVLSLFEKQVYPERINANGEAEVPYDVAGWTLPLQMGVEYAPVWNVKQREADTFARVTNINEARKVLNLKPASKPFENFENPLKTAPKIGVYKGWTGAIDEGWTRLVFDSYNIPYKSLMDNDFRNGKLPYDTIVLPSMRERELINGNSPKRYPKEYTGGIGTQGVENLKKFVESGGKLVCFDESCEAVIKSFNLPIKNVLEGKTRKEFHCPGSILKLDVDRRFSIAKGFGASVPAYFIYSSAFEITDANAVKSIAKYADRDLLLSGWIYGGDLIKGKTALAEASYGKGDIVLFAFRPQHRGQTYATFPFIFNALEK